MYSMNWSGDCVVLSSPHKGDENWPPEAVGLGGEVLVGKDSVFRGTQSPCLPTSDTAVEELQLVK